MPSLLIKQVKLMHEEERAENDSVVDEKGVVVDERVEEKEELVAVENVEKEVEEEDVNREENTADGKSFVLVITFVEKRFFCLFFKFAHQVPCIFIKYVIYFLCVG